MIAVVGLLLTTGGNNGGTQTPVDGGANGTTSVASQASTSPDNLLGLSLWRVQENEVLRRKGRVDVQLHTQAKLQAQGRTPTPTTEYPDVSPQVGTPMDGVWDTVVEIDPTPSVGRGGVEGIICAYPWPQGCDYWIGIAQCESTLGQDPNAYADWNPYVGLFQVWLGHGYGREWLKDSANNTLAAWELSHEGTRTSPWPWCQWQ